jgi:hypothetical protein
VCSVFKGPDVDHPVITCPVRFRQDLLIAEDAARFFFPANATWTSLYEVRIEDADGVSAGNIDLVLVSYDENGEILDYGSCEVQAVYISGNVRRPFERYMEDPSVGTDFDWTGERHYPRPDFLSSSRKRLAPQLLYKGGILRGWDRKQVVVMDSAFFETLPELPTVPQDEADLAWLVYDLRREDAHERFQLTRSQTVYTSFDEVMPVVTTAKAGPERDFLVRLKERLQTQVRLNLPDAPVLGDILNGENTP